MVSGNVSINEDLGALMATEHRPAFSCDDCRVVWFGTRTLVSEHCPSCGGQNVSESDLPGALLLNPGVEWPDDCPWREE